MAPTRHRSSATWLALAYAALVVYASLYPFSGWRWPPGQSFQALAWLAWPPWKDDFDLWSNLGGYLPLGALLMVGAQRSGWRLWPALALALLLPAALSYTLEVLQQFLPGRHPSLKDWALNSGGAAIGVALALLGRALGLDRRWHELRLRWFTREGAGGLALLALWPVALLFPAPAPLGLGQIGPWLGGVALAVLQDVPWAEPLPSLLQAQAAAATVQSMPPLNALAITALGLLAPCLLAFALMPPGLRRVGGVVVVALLGAAGMTLSTLLNFGPRHALAWVTPLTPLALAAGALPALLLLAAGRRLASALGLVALTWLVTLVAQAPADPFFAQNLANWEQGAFVRFHGLAQWLGWLWPFAAMVWLLTRLATRHRPDGLRG